jgi:hypothetical protein
VDAPHAISLAPTLHLSEQGDVSVQLPSPGGTSPQAHEESADGHGHLVRNVPGALPSKEQQVAEESARVKAFTEGFAQEIFAGHRVTNGLVDPYFDDVKSALAEHTKNPPPLNIPEIPILSDYTKAAANYGKTGSPYAPGDGTMGDDDLLGHLVDQQDMSSVGPNAGYANTTQMIGAARITGMGRPPGITAVIELFQEPDGRFRSVKLVKSSGDKHFDNFVLAAIPESLGELHPAPDTGPGLHGEAIHTVWAVTGQRIILRDVKEFKTAKEKAYAAGVGLLSTLQGASAFDVTGEMKISDPLHPRYTSTVTLLRVY